MDELVSVIIREAQEKAKELEIIADEEYHITKHGIVRQAQKEIDATYATKLHKSQMEHQTRMSRLRNRHRLMILSEKQSIYERTVAEAGKRLRSSINRKNNKYKRLLGQLILEAMLALLDDTVLVRVKKGDVQLIKKLIPDLESQYQSMSGRKVQIGIHDTSLPPTCSGGAIVTNGDGKIEIDNTLDARLQLAAEHAMPIIKSTLFG
uniref:ARAD1D41316p n=1 Tax=Blastobotrys adeninivorans TaxID=409370 RepID=A0A060THW6_BLAAD